MFKIRGDIFDANLEHKFLSETCDLTCPLARAKIDFIEKSSFL